MSPHPTPSGAPSSALRRVSSPASSSTGMYSYTTPRNAESVPTTPMSPMSPGGGFFGGNNNQGTPLPNAEPNAPTSIFGKSSKGTPKPSFDAPTSLTGNATPKPSFGADPMCSPSPIGEAPTPWKKPKSIPRIPGPMSVSNRRKSSNKDGDKQEMMGDIDMI